MKCYFTRLQKQRKKTPAAKKWHSNATTEFIEIFTFKTPQFLLGNFGFNTVTTCVVQKIKFKAAEIIYK